jgi:chorismate mutase
MTFDYLNSFRKQIDRVDGEILFLVKRRFHLAKKIAKYKMDNDLDAEDLNREDEIIANVLNQAGMMDLRDKFVRDLFNMLIEKSKSEQKKFIDKKESKKK